MHRTIEEDRNSVTVTAGRASPIAKMTVVNDNAVSDHRNTVYLTPAGLRELAARLDEAADTIEAERGES